MRPLVLALASLILSTTALADEPTTATPAPVALRHAVVLRDAGIVTTSLGLAGATGVLVVAITWSSDRCDDACAWTGLAFDAVAVPASVALLSAGIPMWVVGKRRSHAAHLLVAPTLVPQGAGASLAMVW